MSSAAEASIGTSGYVYRHWRKGVFYPAGLPAREELAYYAIRFRTVELNNPFYRLPTAETFQRWRDSTPADFQVAVKASRSWSWLGWTGSCPCSPGPPLGDRIPAPELAHHRGIPPHHGGIYLRSHAPWAGAGRRIHLRRAGFLGRADSRAPHRGKGGLRLL